MSLKAINSILAYRKAVILTIRIGERKWELFLKTQSTLPTSPTEMNLSEIAQLQFYPSSPITSICTLVQQAIGTLACHLIREKVPGPEPCISPMLLDPAVKRQPVVTDLTWKFTSLTQTLWFFSTGRLFMKTIFSHGFSVPEEARGHIFISFYQRPYQGLTFKSDHLICGEEIMFCTAFYATKCSWK